MQVDWLAGAARDRPDHPFLVLPDGSVSFREMEGRVRRVVGALRAGGVGDGDRVAVWPRNTPDGVAAMLGVPRSGATGILLNTRLAPSEAARLVATTRAEALAGPGPDLGVPRLDLTAGRPEDGVVPRPDRPHSVVFTSGSTGPSRPVVLTWGNLEASAAASAAHLDHHPDDRWLCVLPVFHVGGLGILVRSARQRSSVLLENGFDPGRVADLLAHGRATLASLVAVMLRRVLDTGPSHYRGVRAVLVGGGPAPVELLREAAAAGLPVLPTYGMTETASQVATAPVSSGLEPVDRVAPLPGVGLRIGASGRIEVRGAMVSPGDLDGPSRPPGAWFVTGDAGEIDDAGLRVLGRVDDVVVTGGENVHPSEVEAVLRAHPGVEDAAVVGIPDRVWGSAVAAAYEGTADADDLDRHLRASLAGFKIPRRWMRVDVLPRLPLGKPDRAAVRRMFGD